MKNSVLPIHVGMHKTGTTFLQRSVFPVMFPGVPTDRTGSIENRGREADYILGATRGDPTSPFRTDESTTIISSESLSGRQKANYPGECFERFMRFVDSLSGLEREPRIVIFIRPHLPWLRSSFLHQYRTGSSRSWHKHVADFSRDDLSWSKRISALKDYPLLVIDYQDFVSSPAEVVRRIGTFFEADPKHIESAASVDFSVNHNATPSDAALKALRFQMKVSRAFRRRAPKWLGPYLEPSSRTQDAIATAIDRLPFGQKRELKGQLSIKDPDLLRFLEEDWERAIALGTGVSLRRSA